MDWRSLLRNRWTWVAAGGGALAGLVVYLRRRSSGGGDGGAPGSEPAAYSPGGVGFPDSTATDVARQLGERQADWEATFNQFKTDVEQQIAAIDTPEAPSTPPPVYTPPTAPPPTRTVGTVGQQGGAWIKSKLPGRSVVPRLPR